MILKKDWKKVLFVESTNPFRYFHDFTAPEIVGNLSAERETLLHRVRLFILETWLKIWRSIDRGRSRGGERVRERALLPRWKFIHLERDRGTRYGSERGADRADLSRSASSFRFYGTVDGLLLPPPPWSVTRENAFTRALARSSIIDTSSDIAWPPVINRN